MGLRVRDDVVVIGAGLSGLTCGLVLAESGLSVRILAEREPSRTSSAKAGASWGPMGLDSRVLRWCRKSFTALSELAAKSDSGVRMIHGTEAFEEQVEPPSWATEVPDFA